MYLTTRISNAAGKKLLWNLGRYIQYSLDGTKKRNFRVYVMEEYVRLTPFKSKHDLPHEIQFVEDQRYFHVMWTEKKIFCRKCGSVHMLGKKCYDNQTGSVCHEGGWTIDTRPQYPDRVERNEQFETNNAANKVVAESMGPGYPEVVRGTPQIERSSRNSIVNSTHIEVVAKTDLAVRQSGKSNQDNGSKIMAPVS